MPFLHFSSPLFPCLLLLQVVIISQFLLLRGEFLFSSALFVFVTCAADNGSEEYLHVDVAGVTSVRRLWLALKCYFCSVWELAVLLAWTLLWVALPLLVALLIMLGVLYLWYSQRESASFVHPFTESFPSACPPNYRFYPNYERVLGMPAPLYSDLHPPFHVVHQYYRQSLKCWHDDKRARFPLLSDEQWREIQKLIRDSYHKLTHTSYSNTVLPRLLVETGNPKEAFRLEDSTFWDPFEETGNLKQVVELEDSTFWKNTIQPASVALYRHNCTTCTLKLGLENEPQPILATESELQNYCPCTLDMALETYRWFWKNNMPPFGPRGLHKWYSESAELHPTSSLFDVAIFLLGQRFFVPFGYLSGAEKRQLVKERCYELYDFSSDTEEGGVLYDLEKRKVEELHAANLEQYHQFRAAERALADIHFDQLRETARKAIERKRWCGWVGNYLGGCSQ
jgi:hypothetical protein